MKFGMYYPCMCLNGLQNRILEPVDRMYMRAYPNADTPHLVWNINENL